MFNANGLYYDGKLWNCEIRKTAELQLQFIINHIKIMVQAHMPLMILGTIHS